jgi:hypothetical protein
MAFPQAGRRHDQGKNGRKTQGNCGRNPPVDTGEIRKKMAVNALLDD